MPRNKPDITAQAFWLTTLGCKVNQYDGNVVSRLLRCRGWRPVPSPKLADLLVINTCCVTKTAMRKSRQAITKACRSSPEAAVMVVGCYSDYDSERLSGLLASLGLPPSRSTIAGHHDDLPARIGCFLDSISAEGNGAFRTSLPAAAFQPGGNRYDVSMSVSRQASGPATSNPTTIKARRSRLVKKNISTSNTFRRIDGFAGHSRAFVKVQDGCDALCTYCIVPYTRCRVWSKSAQEVEAECRQLVGAGHREIVLCGVFLGAFGRGTALRKKWDSGQSSLLGELVLRVAAIDGLWRVRLSSLEPGDVTDELLGLCRSTPRFAPHFHLPLQSGSQRILRRMNRQYTVDGFRDAADRIRESFDRPAITTDIIVGFPGEEDEDFAATLEMVRYAGFAKIHAFPFSPIEPTTAWQWRGEAPSRQVVTDRMAKLTELEAELATQYRMKFIGEILEGLVERQKAEAKNARQQAITDRYFRIMFNGGVDEKDAAGEIVALRVTRVSDGTVEGQLVGCD